MDETMYLKVSPKTVAELSKLQYRFGDNTPEEVIVRAVETLRALEPYVKDRVLTVVDPDLERPDEPVDERLVEFRFEHQTA